MEELYFTYDGQSYKRGETVHDLGSFVCTEVTAGNVRSYTGLSTDISKLPTYEGLGAGSSAYCVDSGELYMYDKSTKTWKAQ